MSEDLGLSMPFAPCWKKLLDLEVQTLLTGIKPSDIQTPKPIYSIFNTAIGANTNFIVPAGSSTPPLTPLHAPCIFRIYVALSAAGIFSVQRTRAGTTTTEYMNQGVALAANSAYMFDVIVDSSEGIDFQTTVAATILKLSVVEKDDAK